MMIDQLWDVLQGNRLKGAVILKENGSIEDDAYLAAGPLCRLPAF